MWPFSKAKVAEPSRSVTVLSRETLEAGILAGKGDGVHMAVLYATMLGFGHELLREPDAISEFITFIQRPPDLTPDGIQRAVSRVIHDADVMCRGPSFNVLTYGPQGDQNAHLRPLLDPYRRAIEKHGAAQVFAAANFDVGTFIQKVALERRERDVRAILGKLDEKRPYLAPLLMRARAKGRNKYGDLDYTEFFSELTDFLKTYFNETNLPFFYTYLPLMLCLEHIEPWMVKTEDGLSMPVDGIDFEHWCAARIEEQGWVVRVSKASGDQGIDIEAMRGGKLVAIQCKRYTQPIGNKSVQEAYTGATHYRADRAVVIGTGGYTRAAIELAENTGVILIDAENIAAFTELVAVG
ncbi:MAG: restriction endonuclease [Sphingomonas sp.]|nr:MAG: restriction endonuclease [Sphingomonas sp.]